MKNNELTSEILDLKHQLKQLEVIIQSEKPKTGPFDVVETSSRMSSTSIDSNIPGFEHIEQLRK